MSETCVFCDLSADKEIYLFDTGGVSGRPVCSACKDRLRRRSEIFDSDVCIVCATHEPNPAKARGIGFRQEPQMNLHYCDGCRLSIRNRVPEVRDL